MHYVREGRWIDPRTWSEPGQNPVSLRSLAHLKELHIELRTGRHLVRKSFTQKVTKGLEYLCIKQSRVTDWAFASSS